MEKEFYQNSQLAQAPFPSKPNTTRWNLHFSMIRMALAIREAIDAHYRAFIGSVGSRRLKFGENLLTPVQLRQLEVLQPILKLAAAATKDMEQASGTLCMVLDYHAILRDEIERLIGESQNSEDLDSESKEEIKKFLEAVEAKLALVSAPASAQNAIVHAGTDDMLPTASTTITDSPIGGPARKMFLGSFAGEPNRPEAFLSRVRDVIRSDPSPQWTAAVLWALPIALTSDAAVWHEGLSDAEAAGLTFSY
ncbi:hypothetical protein CF336_g6887 [Tilletia laevis]|uniref:Uncharacterized protein n=1 Tax=Tilletia caries TaxID=13290 RepID=A0A8T8STK4_9BASI|nr:hypothetical protein CF336_g6887 [Tilletia laevis]KAE8248700.1 hypothetical protein A4X03_0g6720 [Tilletia caries]